MQKKAIFVILAILVLIIALFAWLNRPAEDVASGELAIVIDNRIAAVYTLADLEAMETVELQKEIVSGSGDNQSGLFTGVALRTVLTAADPKWAAGAQTVIATAEDGFTASFSVAEVEDNDNILVAYMLDHEELAGREDGGKGPFRIVVRDDAFGNRCVYWLCRIEVD